MQATDSSAIEVLGNWTRAWWGVCGCLLAVLVKFHGQDLHWVHVHLDTRAYDRLINLAIVYFIMLLALLPVGAIVAAASRENNRAKIIAMAVAAPALVTTWAGGDKSAQTLTLPHLSSFISSATAAGLDVSTSSASSGISLRDGFSQFFGFNKDENKYYVIAGPFKSENEASALGMKIMKTRPSIQVFSGKSDAKSDSTVLIFGYSQPYGEAKAFRDKVKELPELKDARDVWLTTSPPGLSRPQ